MQFGHHFIGLITIMDKTMNKNEFDELFKVPANMDSDSYEDWIRKKCIDLRNGIDFMIENIEYLEGDAGEFPSERESVYDKCYSRYQELFDNSTENVD